MYLIQVFFLLAAVLTAVKAERDEAIDFMEVRAINMTSPNNKSLALDFFATDQLNVDLQRIINKHKQSKDYNFLLVFTKNI